LNNFRPTEKVYRCTPHPISVSPNLLSFFLFHFAILGFEVTASRLLGRQYTAWAMPPSAHNIIISLTLLWYVCQNKETNICVFLLTPVFLFQDPVQDTTLLLVVISPESPLGYDSFSVFPLVFMILTVLRYMD
jgi:hypothetical protein